MSPHTSSVKVKAYKSKCIIKRPFSTTSSFFFQLILRLPINIQRIHHITRKYIIKLELHWQRLVQAKCW